MSAEGQEVAAPAAPVDQGPVEITVVGQTPATPEAPASEEASAEPKSKEPAGLEEEPGETPAPGRNNKGQFTGVQDRIDEITRARRAAERDAEYWRTRAIGSAEAPKQAPAKPTAPNRDDFASDAEYIDAVTDYKVEQKLAVRAEQQSQEQAHQAKASSWNSKLEAARAEIADFDTVMNASTEPVAGHVAELIMEHDQGAKVAHFYAANPEALAKLNEMSPAKAAFEIGRTAAKFEAAPAASSKPAEKATSNAPPPASRQVGAGRATTPKLEDMSQEEYMATRKAQGASWAR